MPITQEVKWGADNDVALAPTLTEEEELSLRARMSALDKLLSDQGLAKYKIELSFEYKRSRDLPTFGMMSFWESGSKFHGGGDTKMYFCAGRKLKKNDCEAFIPDASTGYGHLVCPRCKIVWQGEQVDGEVGARLSMQGWATLIQRYFLRLDCCADIYLKFPRQSLRAAASVEQNKQMMGDKLTRARADIQKCIYPLRHIISETSAGADLHGRFVAFLRA